MFMVNGVLPASAATSRLIFQLSGTCWNPLVFDMTVYYPVDENGLVDQIVLSFMALIADRSSIVAPIARCISSHTSDEFIKTLVDMHGEMTIYAVEYTIPYALASLV